MTAAAILFICSRKIQLFQPLTTKSHIFPAFPAFFPKNALFSSLSSLAGYPIKNLELKIHFWWVEAHKKKKSAIFITSILPYTNFGSVFILYQCIEYWINIQNIYSFMYQKMWLFYLFLKSSKALSVSLK